MAPWAGLLSYCRRCTVLCWCRRARRISSLKRGREARTVLPPKGNWCGLLVMPPRRPALVDMPSYLASRPPLRWHRRASCCTHNIRGREACPRWSPGWASLCPLLAAMLVLPRSRYLPTPTHAVEARTVCPRSARASLCRQTALFKQSATHADYAPSARAGPHQRGPLVAPSRRSAVRITHHFTV